MQGHQMQEHHHLRLHLPDFLAESISLFADISQREAVSNAMKQYDSSVARACEVIEEGQRKVDEAERAILIARRKIQKGKPDLQQAQKNFLTEVKEILNVNKTQSAAPSSRQECAKRRSSVNSFFDCPHFFISALLCFSFSLIHSIHVCYLALGFSF
jgi:hypothetical protein